MTTTADSGREAGVRVAKYTLIGAVVGGLFSLVGSFSGSVYTNEAHFREIQLQLATEERRDDISIRRTAYVTFVSEAGQHRRWLNDVIAAVDSADQAAYDAARIALSDARARVFAAAATVYLVGNEATNEAAARYANTGTTPGRALENVDASKLREMADRLDAAVSDFLTAADADLPARSNQARPSQQTGPS